MPSLLSARRRPLALLAWLYPLVMPAFAQNAAVAPLFQLSTQQDMVIDTRAKLAWPRCAEGMQWDGKTCTGVAQTYTYKQALALAAERSHSDGLRWRLPRVNEFKRLLDRKAKPPGLNPALFPAAPRDWHWTATAAVNTQRINSYNYSQVDKSSNVTALAAQQAWAIDTETLQTTPDMGKGNALLLRLVRPASEQELQEL